MSGMIHPQKLSVKLIMIGSAISIAVVLLLTCLICGVLLLTTGVQSELLPYIMLIADAVGSFIGAYCCAALNKSYGLVSGFLCGFIVFVLFFAVGVSTGDSISLLTLYRLLALTVFGMLGGIKGVNKKERVRIK